MRAAYSPVYLRERSPQGGTPDQAQVMTGARDASYRLKGSTERAGRRIVAPVLVALVLVAPVLVGVGAGAVTESTGAPSQRIFL
ncbi:hypothetical protein [Microbispora bryophytorum]|uniref:hypothetical protein n=1 Tax=Microbispora bryophytorum TaxID=1460882 RepID=UPI0034067932